MKKEKVNIREIVKLSSNLHILYVEDDDTLREKSILMFQNIFKSVEGANNGLEAFAKYKKQLAENTPYDIVITDINMPIMDGLELSSSILELHPIQKILAISAYNDSDKLEALIDIGVTNYIHKPVTLERLLSVVQKTAMLIQNDKNHEKNMTQETMTGIKNYEALHDDLKNTNGKYLFLIHIKNFNAIETTYGVDKTELLMDKFISILVEIFQSDQYVYRKNANGFACLVCEEKKIEEVIGKINDRLGESEFDIVYGVSKEQKNLKATAIIALDFAVRHGLGYKVYDSDIDFTDDYKNRALLKNIINTAITEDTVFPVFQALYDRDKNILRYEVLMRIGGVEGNERQIARESNMYGVLAKLTLEKAFYKMQFGESLFSIPIFYEDIRNGYLIDFIEEQILLYLSSGIGSRLILEISETKTIENHQLIELFVERFKKYGVKIALNDFGAGGANLNHIIDFDSDYVKIDGALIKNMEYDKKALAIVRCVVSFTKELGIKTIAPCVDSKEIFQRASSLGINEFQGFYLSEPLKEI